jgi:hypothetical protein
MCLGTKQEREALDVSDFYGFQEVVEQIRTHPAEALKLILKRSAGWDWDGKVKSTVFAAEELRQECLIERSMALFGGRQKEVEEAYGYIQSHKQLTCLDHQPGDEVTLALAEKRKIVINAVPVALVAGSGE